MSNLILPDKPPIQLDKQAEMQRRLADLRANQYKLDNCPKHHFPDFPNALPVGVKFECAHCGGKMEAIHAYSYTKGYVAHGGLATDIIPAWNEPLTDEQSANSVNLSKV